MYLFTYESMCAVCASECVCVLLILLCECSVLCGDVWLVACVHHVSRVNFDPTVLIVATGEAL